MTRGPIELFKNGVQVFEGEASPAPGGGSMPGAAFILGPIPVTFDMAGLNTGVVVYTAPSDLLLLNAWLSITEAWNGTTPIGDMGGVTGGASPGFGLFGEAGMTQVDQEMTSGTGLNGPENPPMSYGHNEVFAFLPSGTDLYFWVSRDGSKGGTDPGSDQGASGLYLLLSTPEAP